MAFLQIKQILKHVQQLRGRIRQIAGEHRATTTDDALLSFLARTEAMELYMGDLLDQHVESSKDHVLNTWIQFPNTETLDQEIESLATSMKDDEPVNELSEQLLAIDDRILGLYQSAAEQSHSKRVRDFFDELLNMESQKARRKSWNYTQTRDI